MRVQVRLLAELHWQLPHSLSPAEANLETTVLPRLESTCHRLTADIQARAVLHRRSIYCQISAEPSLVLAMQKQLH